MKSRALPSVALRPVSFPRGKHSDHLLVIPSRKDLGYVQTLKYMLDKSRLATVRMKNNTIINKLLQEQTVLPTHSYKPTFVHSCVYVFLYSLLPFVDSALLLALFHFPVYLGDCFVWVPESLLFLLESCRVLHGMFIPWVWGAFRLSPISSMKFQCHSSHQRAVWEMVAIVSVVTFSISGSS